MESDIARVIGSDRSVLADAGAIQRLTQTLQKMDGMVGDLASRINNTADRLGLYVPDKNETGKSSLAEAPNGQVAELASAIDCLSTRIQWTARSFGRLEQL